MVRKSGLIMLVVVPLLLAFWLYLARNTLVESIAELSLEKVTGAPANLEGVSVGPFTLSAGFERLTLADPAQPGRDMIITGPARFDLNGLQLFARKLVIEDMTLEGVEPGAFGLGTPTSDSTPPASGEGGSGTPGSQSTSSTEGTSGTEEDAAQKEESPFSLDFPIPKLDLSALTKELDVERLTSDQPLASERALDEAEQELDRRMAALDKRLADADLEVRSARIEQDYKRIDFSSKDPNKLKASLDAAKRVGEDIRVVRDQTRALTREVSEARRAVSASVDKAEQELKADVDAAMRLAKLGDLNTGDIGRLLFGQAVQQQVNWVLDKFRQVKAMVGSDSEPQGDLPRRSGRLIGFPVTGRAYPGFLLERAAFSGRLPSLSSTTGNGEDPKAELEFSGLLQGLNSNSAVYGAPTLMSAKASNAKGESWVVSGRYDPRQADGAFRAQATGRKVQLERMPLAGGPLPRYASSPDTSIEFTLLLKGDHPQGVLRIEAQDARFHFSEPEAGEGATQAALRKEIKTIFASIDHFIVGGSISSADGKRRVRISSSLDEQVSRGLKALLGQRRAAAEARVREQLEARIADRRKAVTDRVQQRIAPLEDEVKALENRMAQLHKQLRDKQAQAEQNLKEQARGSLLKKLRR